MIKTLSLLLTLVITIFTLAFAPQAKAANLAHGGQIFANNCASCHIGGGNVVNPGKTLKQADLTANQRDTVEAIITKVSKGGGGMSAFAGRLKEEDITDVAAYVLSQAANDWK